MCTGLEAGLLVGSSLVQGYTQIQEGKARQVMQNSDADQIQAEAMDHARKIRIATRKEVGAARAATAAGGTALDEFSGIITDDIERLGAEDASMAILSGNNRARSLRLAGDMQYEAAKSRAIGGLISDAGKAYSGWKGAKSTNYSYNGDESGAMYSRTGAGIRGRR